MIANLLEKISKLEQRIVELKAEVEKGEKENKRWRTMTNYEKYKDEIDEIFDTNDGTIAINKNTNEITNCSDFECSKCLFSAQYNNTISCAITMAKWLVAEYVEPEIDWTKVQVDTPVLVSDDGIKWFRRYFAKVSSSGTIYVYCNGATSWSADGDSPVQYKYAELEEVI